MGNCTGNRSTWQPSESQRDTHDEVQRGTYQAVEPARSVPELFHTLRYNAMVMWVSLPVIVIFQAIPDLQPDCGDGFSLYVLLGVAALLAHHVLTERRAWRTTQMLVTRPEWVVLNTFGILRKRRRMAVLGIVEALDVYTDLSFVFLARDCSGISAVWFETWERLPVVGHVVADSLRSIRFWGVAAAFNVTFLVIGFFSMLRLFAMDEALGKAMTHAESAHAPDRVPGDVFFILARSADVAMLPSIACICEEMGVSKAHMYDPKKDPRARSEAHENLLLGKIDFRAAEALELEDEEERKRVDTEQHAHFLIMLFTKVLVGNSMQLWLQGSFFQISFNVLGQTARIQLLCSMVFSSMSVLVRCKNMGAMLGRAGCPIVAVILGLLAWTFAKIYFAFTCEDHLWNLTTGCVSLSLS